MRCAFGYAILFFLLLTTSFCAQAKNVQVNGQNASLTDSTGCNITSGESGINAATFRRIKRKYARLEKFMQHRTEKMLRTMEIKERSLQHKIEVIDSIRSQKVFSGSLAKYEQLEAQLQGPVNTSTSKPLNQYVAGLDSIQTAFKFLTQVNANTPGVSSAKLQQLIAANQQIGQADSRLQQAEQVQQFIKTRRQELNDQLSKSATTKQLLGINKEAFYAQQQLVEYKEMINDKRKTEEKLLEGLNGIPAFQKFMQKNSYLGQLFSLPDNYGDASTLTGLQTRSQVQQLLQQVVATAGNSTANGDPAQYVSQQILAAQGQMKQLKDKISLLGNSGGSGDMTMPSFIPNDQKTKTFLKRIVLGANVQTQPSSYLLPAMANLGFTVGYKLTGNMTAGIGGAYQLGVGTGWNHIAFSNQGVSVRSFFDLRVKGSWWASGGFEFKYMQGFKEWSLLNKINRWQQGALIGITKKYKIKSSKEGNVQVMFDALYNQHVPATQPLIFRTGVNF